MAKFLPRLNTDSIMFKTRNGYYGSAFDLRVEVATVLEFEARNGYYGSVAVILMTRDSVGPGRVSNSLQRCLLLLMTVW